MSYETRPLAGVRGWLAFFVVTLILSALTGLIQPLIVKGTTTPELTMRPGWTGYLGVLWLLTLVRTGGYTYLAWLLNARQVASTPRTVIAGLWLLALVPSLLDVLAVALLLELAFMPVLLASLAGMIRPVVYSTLWTAYLLRSRRVANTYADDTGTLAAVFE